MQLALENGYMMESHVFKKPNNCKFLFEISSCVRGKHKQGMYPLMKGTSLGPRAL